MSVASRMTYSKLQPTKSEKRASTPVQYSSTFPYYVVETGHAPLQCHAFPWLYGWTWSALVSNPSFSNNKLLVNCRLDAFSTSYVSRIQIIHKWSVVIYTYAIACAAASLHGCCVFVLQNEWLLSIGSATTRGVTLFASIKKWVTIATPSSSRSEPHTGYMMREATETKRDPTASSKSRWFFTKGTSKWLVASCRTVP